MKYPKDECYDLRVKYRGSFDIGDNLALDCVYGTKFLWLPKKINNQWHWLTIIWVKHIPRQFFINPIPREYYSKDEFLLYRLSHDIEPINKSSY